MPVGGRAITKIIISLLLVISSYLLGLGLVIAQTGTDFPGTVLNVDLAAGKLTVKKEEGGTRFTFVVNDKTQFTGAGLSSLKDVKKGDRVTVHYVVSGGQYIAQKVTGKNK